MRHEVILPQVGRGAGDSAIRRWRARIGQNGADRLRVIQAGLWRRFGLAAAVGANRPRPRKFVWPVSARIGRIGARPLWTIQARRSRRFGLGAAIGANRPRRRRFVWPKCSRESAATSAGRRLEALPPPRRRRALRRVLRRLPRGRSGRRLRRLGTWSPAAGPDGPAGLYRAAD